MHRLEELRLVAQEDRLDALLAAGRHSELVGELEALVESQPLRERLWGQLLLALYRSGRQADALDAYAALATSWSSSSVSSGADLRRLQRGILEQDPDLDAPAPRARTIVDNRRARREDSRSRRGRREGRGAPAGASSGDAARPGRSRKDPIALAVAERVAGDLTVRRAARSDS